VRVTFSADANFGNERLGDRGLGLRHCDMGTAALPLGCPFQAWLHCCSFVGWNEVENIWLYLFLGL
jgi:hypothetical protein